MIDGLLSLVKPRNLRIDLATKRVRQVRRKRQCGMTSPVSGDLKSGIPADVLTPYMTISDNYVVHLQIR